MDTSDRSEPNLPVPVSAPSFLPSGLAPAFAGDLATTASPSINSGVILRGLKRYGALIFSIWLVAFAIAYVLISRFVEPTYEVSSVLRIEPAQKLFEHVQDDADSRGLGSYLQTQAALITDDRVLNPAVTDPLVVKLPVISNSENPKADLRKKMSVQIIDDTFLIRIALELTNGEHAATIVNAVVSSYLEYNKEYKRSANAQLNASLTEQLGNIEKELKEEKNEQLQEKLLAGNVDFAKPKLNLGTSLGTSNDDPAQPTFSSLTSAHVQTMVEQMLQTDLELAGAQAHLEARRETAKQASDGKNTPQRQQDIEELQLRVADEFQKDPEVVALIDEIKDAKKHLDRATSLARSPADFAVRAADKHHKELTEEYVSLWNEKYDRIHERLKVAADPLQSANAVNELEMKVEELLRKRAGLAAMFEKLSIEKKEVNKDAYQATLLTYKVNKLLENAERVKTNLQQLEFANNQENYRVVQLSRAVSPNTPTNNKRVKYLAAAPVGILFLLLGAFLLLEIKAERVADPDSLSTRVRSEVYALPPLPGTRSVRKLGAPKADDQIEQFIQRLDHLRFGVCGNQTEVGRGRCVLITSAVRGEGKTALGSNLAARCGQAGMSTLLIDADLHRSTLCALLDVPDGPGLSDILKEEAALDEVVIPIQGGAFYLLPAGTPIKDTSRVLQGRNFASLIAQLRQLYELVIIDSPPVLPVPDALILGRSADGAVLASRYDISRFPQVERARRKLNDAGIAILGTVINGMRHSDRYYGRYSYNRQRSSPSNSSDTI